MFPSLATALVLLSSTTLTLAFSKISVPTSITADVSAQIKLTTSPSFDSKFAFYRVYLAMTPPGWGTGPACYLVNSSSTNIVDFNVAIPASVGPSGSQYYSISIMQFNTDPNAESTSSGFQYSSHFSFTGGKGTWSTYETTGHSVGDADTLPCTAYDCARTCSQKYYPADVSDDDESSYKSAYECIGSCPGVNQPSWDELVSAYDSDSSTSGVSSTANSRSATKTASTTLATATGTGSVAAQSTASSTASRTSSVSGSNGASGASSTSSATNTSTNASVQNQATVFSALFTGLFALVAMSNV